MIADRADAQITQNYPPDALRDIARTVIRDLEAAVALPTSDERRAAIDRLWHEAPTFMHRQALSHIAFEMLATDRRML